MASNFFAVGVIAKASKDFSEVFVVIDNDTKLFKFSKAMFYIIGKRCQVDMTEALEFGMNVDVCYKLCPSGDKRSLVAVWLGDRPNFLEQTNAIYNQEGRVRYITYDHLVVRNENAGHTVFIDKRVVFPFGEKIDAAKGDVILYDAVLNVDTCAFDATRAWFEGAEPGIFDHVFREEDAKNYEIKGCINMVCGTVCVIQNDAAVVNVDMSPGCVDVLLFRSKLIEDVGIIDVGDILCMRLCFDYIDDRRKWWIAVEAKRDGIEICVPETQTKSAMVENTVMSTREDVLYRDPPLSGLISRCSSESMMSYICYDELKIYVDRGNVYINGCICDKSLFIRLITSSKIVNFEAVSTTRFGEMFSHETTCVWVGEKPSLSVIMSKLIAPTVALLKEPERSFEGLVTKIYLPDVAVIDGVWRRPAIVLPLSAFTSESRDKCCISDFVKINDRVQFTVGEHPDYPEFPCAFNVDVVNKKSK